MTLHLSQPDAGALRAVHRALAPDAALPPSAAAVLRHSAGRPQPLLALTVHALRGRASRLAAADRTGWRFLLRAPAPGAAGPDCPHVGCDAAGGHGPSAVAGASGASGAFEASEVAAASAVPAVPDGAAGVFTARAAFAGDGLERVVAAAEVTDGPAGPAFSHLTAGPYLDSTVRALRQAWQLTHGTPGRYEPRLLSLPEHYASALWLHGDRAGEDLLIPLAPAPLGVTAHQVLPAAELLARLERAPAARPVALTVVPG